MMEEENKMEKEEIRMGEMEERRAMEVEVVREKFYPHPLYSYEDSIYDGPPWMGEMEERRAMAVEVGREKFYPHPLYSHEDIVKDGALFIDSLCRFHHSMGTNLSIPMLGGKEIDLHLLYRGVTQRGGLEKAILEKRFSEVVMAFSFPPSTTNVSFMLKMCYLNLLHHYEQVYFFGAQGPLIPPAASCLTKIPKIKLERPPDASNLTTKKLRRRKRDHAEPRRKGESGLCLELMLSPTGLLVSIHSVA